MIPAFIDIETLPDTVHPGVVYGHPPGWTCPDYTPPERRKRPSNITKADTAEAWERAEDERHAAAVVEGAAAWHEQQRAAAWDAYAARALSPMTGRIHCICYAIDDGPVVTLEGVELRMLEDLNGALVTLEPHDITLIGHNIKGFDLPFLRVRAMKHSTPLQHSLPAATAKPWEQPVTDTMEAWPCGSRFGKANGSAKLTDIAAFLGIETPPNPIDGSQVLAAYLDPARRAAIAEHCRHDVEVLRSVWYRMQWAGLVP